MPRAEQEADLLRAFRARLFDVQAELDMEKSKTDDGASVWIEKNRQLEKDLDWAKEMADRLERMNQGLVQENQRLKTENKTQEDDRWAAAAAAAAAAVGGADALATPGALCARACACVLAESTSSDSLWPPRRTTRGCARSSSACQPSARR